MPESRKPPSKIAGGKFEVEKRLGAGCFGEVWRALDSSTKQQVAVKFEDAQNHSNLQLEHEVEVLRILSTPVRQQGFVECLYWGDEGRFRCLVMDLLGRSLEDRMQGCKGKLSPPTVVLIAEQLLCRIEYLHSKGLIHRDIKPENFMFGTKDKIHHIYIIDFGLSKRYWDQRHVPKRERLSLTGTARYASINAHRGLEQSRRDDLEAIGHMLMYFLRGSLPWSGLEARTQEEKYKRIRQKKEEVRLSDLCQGFPEAFATFLSTARGLDFTERPDYAGLLQLFRDLRAKEGKLEDHSFQWLEGRDLGKLTPLQPWEGCRQPDDMVPKESLKEAGAATKGKPRPSSFPFCLCGGRQPAND